MVPTGTNSERTAHGATPASARAPASGRVPAQRGAPAAEPRPVSAPEHAPADLRSRPTRPRPARRGRLRRAGESAYGLLLLGRHVVMALVVLVVLAAGVWTSWGTAQHAMLTKGKERGTLTVAACHDDWCTGPFTAGAAGADHPKVRIDATVTDGEGQRIPVVLKPGTHDAVRTGLPGLLHACVPLGGALLLASVLLAGALRLHRSAWALGLAGAGVLGAAFVVL
ncbi:hypothetical protein [Streptomyces buecherae]|uniref:hypothetical protein n=1 Tax=Streptomyces buecherae TaxID=2763006 RepID=UPI0027DFB854|nr:hypothetical protein [Streptomyces buecherae]